MELLIKQKNKDIYYLVKRLLILKRKSLKSFCEDHSLNYSLVYYNLRKPYVDADYLKTLIDSIDEEQTLHIDVSIGVYDKEQNLIYEHK